MQNKAIALLDSIYEVLKEEIEQNPSFSDRFVKALMQKKATKKKSVPPPFNAHEIWMESGQDALVKALEAISDVELDAVAIDCGIRAARRKNKKNLIQIICEEVDRFSKKGSRFNPPVSSADGEVEGDV